MEPLEHLKLPVFQRELERYKRPGGGGFKNPSGRSNSEFGKSAISTSKTISLEHKKLKQQFKNTAIDPSLIFEIEINQGVDPRSFEQKLTSMNLQILSIAENKKGFWVVFSDDDSLFEFQRKLQEHATGTVKHDFFKAIENFGNIPIEKKIGPLLRKNPLSNKPEFVDVELWKITEPSKNKNFISQLKSTYKDQSSFKITDQLITKSIVLLRLKITKNIFDEIIQLKEIARIDRPNIPTFSSYDYSCPDISTVKTYKPNDNAQGILIIDSGVISNHPFLEKCIGDARNFQNGEAEIQDTVGHGTAVAGCAAYSDIKNCIDEKSFIPSNWIFSAKVMYGEKDPFGNIRAIYDPEKLVEHQLKNTVELFLETYPDIKVVNISLGNLNEVWKKDYSRQLPLATIIDELAYDYPNVVFIVSAGNGTHYFSSIEEFKEGYPNYLFDDNNKIINPATSALALTVGSIAPPIITEQPRHGEESIKVPIADEHQPSPFTRTGSGINGMIKPELVEYGGNLILKKSEYTKNHIEDRGSKIPLLNNSTTKNLIKLGYGTSFSAAKVANLAGRLANIYPDASANFIKNLMLVGANYPFKPTKEFYGIEGSNANKKARDKHLLVYGYGLSSLERAIHSYQNRVVLWDENSIKLNDIAVYSFKLPNNLFDEKGKKNITATLTYTPETRSSRGDSYLGNIMEFHIYHTLEEQDIVKNYAANTNRSEIPSDLKKFEIKDFVPGTNTRKTGCHQKAVRELTQKPKTLEEGNLTIVITNKNKWISDENYYQDYCFSLTIEHEAEIDIYNEIRTNIQARTRVR